MTGPGLPRPAWCPFDSCEFLLQHADKVCTGRMETRMGDETHRLCFGVAGALAMSARMGDESLYWLERVISTISTDRAMRG